MYAHSGFGDLKGDVQAHRKSAAFVRQCKQLAQLCRVESHLCARKLPFSDHYDFLSIEVRGTAVRSRFFYDRTECIPVSLGKIVLVASNTVQLFSCQSKKNGPVLG